MHYSCAIHRNNPLTHFCQSCSDVVCEDCVSRQPHSGSTHNIKTLQDSANIRRNHYVNYLNTQINPLRKRIEEKLSCLSEEQKKYEVIKQVIEKDISIEYQTIEGRLSERVQKIIHTKQTQIKHYELFINKLDDLVDAYEKCFQNPQAFLLAYQMFDTEIRKLQSLQKLQSQQSRQTEDLQLKRQISETYQKIQTIEQYEKNNKFMNHLINEFVKNYKKELKEERDKAQKKGKEIRMLYNEKCMKLLGSKVARVCVFCGIAFSVEAANEGCPNNRTFKIKTIYPEIDFNSIIEDDHKGSKRHYWYRAGSEQRKRPDINAHSLIRKAAKKHYLNSLSELQELKYRIGRYEIREGIKVQQLLKGHDNNADGFITKIAFTYTLNKILDVPQQQIQSLVDLLVGQKGIEYLKLRNLMQNPTEDYFNFIHEEQQIQKYKPVGPNSGSLYSKFKY